MDGTRMLILQAAAQQMADKAYHQVHLDDILGDANVTKGALYLHFRSKHELATAVVEYRAEVAGALFSQPHFRSLPGLESIIEMCWAFAVDDIGTQAGRASFNLLEALGRFDGLQSRLLEGWVAAFTSLTRRAAREGDVLSDVDHAQVARLVVSLYMGMRQTSNLDDPPAFLRNLEAAWLLAMPGFVTPDRREYFTAFMRRRTALAIRNAAPLHAVDL